MQSIIALVILTLLTACQQVHRQDQQANALCSMDFGLNTGTSDYQNCKKWVLYALQTGIEPDYATFVCNSVLHADRKPCLDKQQAVYQEMMRVNKEVEAFREEDRKRREEEQAQQAAEAERQRQEQIRKQEQQTELPEHKECTSRGFKKGTSPYNNCRTNIKFIAQLKKQQEFEAKLEMMKILADWQKNQDRKVQESLDNLDRINQQYQQHKMVEQNQRIECQLIHLNNSRSAFQQSLPHYCE